MKKVLISLSAFITLASSAQVIQRRANVQQTNNSNGAVATLNPAVSQAIQNTIKLSTGKTITTRFVNDKPDNSSSNNNAVASTLYNNPSGSTDRAMVPSVMAADKNSYFRETNHTTNRQKEDALEKKKEADGPGGYLSCETGLLNCTISSTEQLPIGSRRFIQQFRPGTVFDLTKDPDVLQGITENRKPITLYCSETGEKVIVNDPSESELQSAVINLLKKLPARNSVIGDVKSEEINNEEEFALKISGGSKCGYSTIAGLFDFAAIQKPYRFLFDLSDETAVISTDNKNGPLFTDSEQQGNPLYGYVKSATYGRRVLVCIETSQFVATDKNKLDETFSSIFKSGAEGLTPEQLYLYNSCRVSLYVIGAHNKDAAVTKLQGSGPDKLKTQLDNYLSNYDYTMLLPIKVLLCDLNGIPKKSEANITTIWERCYSADESFRITLKKVELVSITDMGLRRSYHMWGSCWVKAYKGDESGLLIDLQYRNPQMLIAYARNYIDVPEHGVHPFNSDLNRTYILDGRYPDSRIEVVSGLADNGDIKDSYQIGKYTMYLDDLINICNASSNEVTFNVTGGGFSLNITFSVSRQ